MALSAIDQNNANRACLKQTSCKTESDREFRDRLFAHNWEYFVIKRDERSDRLNTYVECCGSEFKVGEHH